MEATPDIPQPSTEKPPVDPARAAEQRRTIITISIVGIIILALLVVSVVFLLRTDVATTGRIRDIFIIFMALGIARHRGSINHPGNPTGNPDQPVTE